MGHRNLEIKDLLGGDLDSGIILHALIEELSGQKLKKPGQIAAKSSARRASRGPTPSTKFGLLEDLMISLSFLRSTNILKVNITPDSTSNNETILSNLLGILDRDPKQILALFSQLMSKYHFLSITRAQEKERLRYKIYPFQY